MIFNFKKNKDKSVEISNIDDITDLLADKVNAKNDEVMSLTQENERLQREHDASKGAIEDREKRIKLCESVIDQSAKEYDELENEKENILTKLQIKTSDYNQLNNDYKRIKNNYDELSKKKPDKKLKQRNKELEKLLKDSENLIKANTIYRMTYEYISDAKNKQSVKEAFQHNLKLWMENENLSNVKAAELLDVSVSMIAEWKNGRTALTVNSIQEVDLKLCEYFECSVYELVTKKMEGK